MGVRPFDRAGGTAHRHRPAGYRAPSGDLTAQTIAHLVDFGLRYDCSLMGHDYQPYRLRLGDELPRTARLVGESRRR